MRVSKEAASAALRKRTINNLMRRLERANSLAKSNRKVLREFLGKAFDAGAIIP